MFFFVSTMDYPRNSSRTPRSAATDERAGLLLAFEGSEIFCPSVFILFPPLQILKKKVQALEIESKLEFESEKKRIHVSSRRTDR